MIVSDQLGIQSVADIDFNFLYVKVIFNSNDTPGGFGPYRPANDFMYEDGTVQFARVIHWLGPGINNIVGQDLIYFHSNDAPEPTTLILLSLGLVGFGLIGRSRRKRD
jgi:hypothetical protein